MAIGTENATRTAESIHEPCETVVRQIRRYARLLLGSWNLRADHIDDALLVVEELVANVVDHARTEFRLVVSLTGSLLRLAVRDYSHHCPVAQPHDSAAARGRGLQLVQTVATSWGYDSHDRGKTVWAVLTT